MIGLDYYDLTLLVINAYAAAMLGRLKSLPLTFAGAMTLGMMQSYAVGYLPSSGDLSGFRAVVPTLFLFASSSDAAGPAARRAGQGHRVGAAADACAGSVVAGAALVVVVAVLSLMMGQASLLLAGTAATYAMVMLPGAAHRLRRPRLAGAVHRSPASAHAYAKLDSPNLLGLVLAALVAAGVGALVALPVLRLTGLYLALSTLAFGAADGQAGVPGLVRLRVQRQPAGRAALGAGLPITDGGTYVLLMTIFFVPWASPCCSCAAAGSAVLIAMRDSPAACGTLGLNMRWFRVGLFGLSAGMAGLAGALFAGLRQTISATDFQLLPACRCCCWPWSAASPR